MPGADLRYPRRQAIRVVLRTGIAAAMAALADVQIIGKEFLPKNGPLLIVGNHFSFLDPVILIRVAPYPLEFVGGPTIPNAPAWSDFFRKAWGILQIRRGASSRDGLLAAETVLKQKGVLGIFPEGGNWASVLRPARPGAALLAARTPARILPVGLDGLNDVFEMARKGKRARVTVRFGEPFGPFTMDRRDASIREQMAEIGHEMMRRIALLIPPERRGFYSDDPIIREAARGTEVYPWELTEER
jgi:1-acyl-sn-glycerol-3-phosphate acyltransferase